MSSLYSGNPRHVLEEELQETIATTTVYLSSEYKAWLLLLITCYLIKITQKFRGQKQ